MQHTQYDVTILQQFADKLYEQAKSIIASTVTGYGLGAFILALIVVAFSENRNAFYLHSPWNTSTLGVTVLIVVIGLLLGLAEGKKKAFLLKLRAQEVLCQMQIEVNTRRAMGTSD